MSDTHPLILTAAFDEVSSATFQRLRDRHFPPRLNIVPAHLTLFHQLPGPERDAVSEALAALCAREAPIPFRTSGVRFLGRGVAIEIGAARLSCLRKDLARTWQAWLTPQDRQGFRPHVTIQNKVAPTEARTLLGQMQAAPPPVAGVVVGLDLWAYRGGPWQALAHFAFKAATVGAGS